MILIFLNIIRYTLIYKGVINEESFFTHIFNHFLTLHNVFPLNKNIENM